MVKEKSEKSDEKRGKITKVEDTPIYNSLEILLNQWVNPLLDRLPNTSSFDRYGDLLFHKYMDTMDDVGFIFYERKYQNKYDICSLLVYNLISIKTVVRCLWGMKDNKGAPIISNKQYGEFLKNIQSIFVQAQAWRKNLSKYLDKSEENENSCFGEEDMEDGSIIRQS